MLRSWPYLLLLVPAAVLACEDLRTRHVSVVWLAVLGGAAFAAAWLSEGCRTMVRHTAANGALLLIAGLAVAGYLRLRGCSVRHSFGCGDLVCLAALTPLFEAREFVRLSIAACLVALVWWWLCRARRRTVPFVAMLGIVLGGWIMLRIFRLWP